MDNKIRVMVFELTGDRQTMEDGLRTITNSVLSVLSATFTEAA